MAAKTAPKKKSAKAASAKTPAKRKTPKGK